MSSEASVAGLTDFLARKRPRLVGRTYRGRDAELELVAEREVGAQVGVLHLRRFSLLEVEEAESLCHTERRTRDELLAARRGRIDESQIGCGAEVWLFRSSDGRSYYCAAEGIEFSLKPWLDLSLTEAARKRNARLGSAAGRAVASHFAECDSELLGREVVCLHCLGSFSYLRTFMDCPACGRSAGPTTPSKLFCAFFHGREKLMRTSGCEALPVEALQGTERYRLIVHSAWLNHRVIEVGRARDAVRLQARRWDWQREGWATTADRPLAAAEWRRFRRLLDLAPFWELPPEGGHHGFDGADYALEGVKEGQYHYVRRWCPCPNTDRENFSYPCECLGGLPG